MSCLFNSIGQRLDLNPITVRAAICDYLHENQEEKINDLELRRWIEESEEQTIEQYMKHMRNDSSWGGYVEIVAAAALYNINIVVQYKQQQITIGDKKDSKTIKLFYSGNHYW